MASQTAANLHHTSPHARGVVTPGAAEPGDQPHLVSVLGSGRKIAAAGSRDAKLAQIASQQRGRVSRAQLLAAGLSSDVISGLLRRGQLHHLHSGVFAVGHLAPVPLGAETAALLAAPWGSLLSHVSAASLWGLLPPDHGRRAIDVLVGPHVRRKRAGICFHRTRVIEPTDRRIRHGLPVVSPARALLEIAEMVPTRTFERAFDQAEVHRLVRRPELEHALDRLRGRAGVSVVKRLLALQGGTTITRSEAEERFLALVRRADLPPPEVNARLHGFEVDFLWRQARLVVEIDGYQFHGTRRAFEFDRRKDAKLAAAGIAVIRFTWGELVRDALAVIARLAQALAGRAAA